MPWAALEGGVLMQQEIGHGESCSSVSSKLGFATSFGDGSSYVDPNVYEICVGGIEGSGKKGEGPLQPQHRHLQGRHHRGHDRPDGLPEQ